MADQSLTQTPDMQAAGIPGMPEPMSQGGLLDALRSRGTMPSSLAQAMAPAQGANAGLGFGSGVLNALSGGNAALNPYLAQQQEQQNLQRREIARMQEREEARRERQEEARMKIIEGLRDSADPGAQDMYAQEMSRMTARHGMRPIPPQYFKQTAKLGKEELDLVNQDIIANLPPAQIAARHPKVAAMGPGWLQSQIQVLQSPAIRRRMGIPTDEELSADRVKRVRETADAELATWKARNPDVDQKELPYLAKFVLQQTGVPLAALDVNNPEHQRIKAEGLRLAREQVKANDAAWQQLDLTRAAQAETRRAHLAQESRAERELRLKEQEAAGGGGLGKPLSGETTQVITGSARLGQAIDKIDTIASDPKKKKTVEGYIGPLASRLITAQQYAPGGLVVGKTPPDVVDLQQNIATLKNYTIKMITGAALSESEARRIMTELPDVSLPPDQFWRRYENAKANVRTMQRIVDASIIKGDRRALAVMQELQGGPQGTPLSPTPRRIKVRDNKTGKTHWAELGAGDIVPPGYTEIP